MLEHEPTSSADIEQSSQLISIEAGAVKRNGILTLPKGTSGIVLLAADTPLVHQQNIALASLFHEQGLGSLLVDLFSSEELELDAESGYFRENTEIMQQRLIGSVEWLLEREETEHASVGYFGLGIVGAAALIAAAERPDAVAAVVAESRRLEALGEFDAKDVTAPVLLFAVEDDTAGVSNGEKTLELFQVEKRFSTFQGALFSDNQPLAKMVEEASEWFKKHLVWIM